MGEGGGDGASCESRTRIRLSAFAPVRVRRPSSWTKRLIFVALGLLGERRRGEVALEAVGRPVEELGAEAEDEVGLVEAGPRDAPVAEGLLAGARGGVGLERATRRRA